MAPKRGKQLARGPKAARLRAAAGLITTRDFSSTSLPGVSSQGFTMRDEARNTAFHQSSWGQDARLRQKPVTFISGGFTEPLKDTKEMDDPDIRMLENPVNEQNTDPGPFNSGQIPTDARQLETGIPGPVSLVENEYEVPRSGLGIRVDDEPKIDIDTEPVVSGCDSRPSPPLGFFFDLEGDKSLRHVGPRVPVPVRASSPARSDSSEEVILFKGRSGVAHRSVLPQKSQWQFTSFAEGSRNESPLPLDGVIHSGETIAPSKSLKRLSGPEPAHLDPPPFAEDEEDEEDEGDAILADYIANIVAQGDNSESPPNGMFSTGRDLGGDHHAFGFGLEDDDGPEVGRSPDNDSDGGSSTGNDNQHNRDDNGDASDSESGSVIDDESMARLLAKQDELGMGTDMLLLNDGTFGTSKPRRRGGSSPRISPPNMGSVADDFEGLDLTDWNQPDFRKPARSRRSKQPPTFNVSDSELEVALRSAWQTDRERKKKRKLERELLRSEGLLGKNIDPDDPRVKYQSHMVLDDIKSEVVSFLLSAAETVQFPPMDDDARRIVHEIARKFNIKSKSTGKGDQRRPVLYRTKRTTRYTESTAGEARNHVEMASLTIRRRYFHRTDNKGPAVPRASGAKRSGHQAVTYREGEVVGASAPQLGQDNKGHAMLEKMGWSKGMALGALENKGILEPVSQVVKRSKAGLG